MFEVRHVTEAGISAGAVRWHSARRGSAFTALSEAAGCRNRALSSADRLTRGGFEAGRDTHERAGALRNSPSQIYRPSYSIPRCGVMPQVVHEGTSRVAFLRAAGPLNTAADDRAPPSSNSGDPGTLLATHSLTNPRGDTDEAARTG